MACRGGGIGNGDYVGLVFAPNGTTARASNGGGSATNADHPAFRDALLEAYAADARPSEARLADLALVERHVQTAPATSGRMFWFDLNTLSGSYRALTAASRS